MSYAQPTSLAAAIALRQAGARVLAGGTDLYPATAAPELAGPVVDIAGLPGLSGIGPDGAGGIRIGACATWDAIARADLPPALAALQQAARQVGGRQVQNAGTLGGNLCNASPAADGVPPLLAADAMVTLAGPLGARSLPLGDFLLGPRRTALSTDEILTAITIPETGVQGRSAFLKLGARAHLVISIAMVAVRLVLRGGVIESAALAVGSCAPVARRLPALEAALKGLAPGQAAGVLTPAAVAPHLSPLDDLRATASYRAGAAATLLQRAVAEAAGGGA